MVFIFVTQRYFIFVKCGKKSKGNFFYLFEFVMAICKHWLVLGSVGVLNNEKNRKNASENLNFDEK